MKLNLISSRIFLFLFYVFILNSILILNIYKIQIINFNKYFIKSYKNCTKLIPIYPIRGSIFDVNGIPIAINNIKYKLEIIPGTIENIDSFLFNLSKIIFLSKKDILILKNKINKSIPYFPFIIKNNISDNELYNLYVNKFRFPYIKIKKYYIRYYPYKDVLSHLIGYVSKIDKNDLKNIKNKDIYNSYTIFDLIGKVGIEKYYENLLRGKIGFKEIEINNRGKIIRFKNKLNSENGKDLYLSVDINLSLKIKNMLFNSKSAVIVIDPNNGNILSLISNPSFDLNKFIYGLSNEDYKNILLNNNFPMLNRVTQGIYPPASTIKPYIGLYALNSNLINKNTSILDPGYWKLPKSNKIYMDWKKDGRGYINLDRAIEESSDVFFYEIAYKMGIDNLYSFMSNFGYNSYVDIDLFENNVGTLPNKKWKFNKFNSPWYLGDTISVGIGQGYWSVTPLQMSKSLIMLINNGIEKKIHILNKFYDYKLKKDVYINYNNNIKTIDNININFWNLIKNSMYKVANNKNGTAFNYFKNTKYKIAAKTGTAQIFSLNKKKKYISNKLRNHKLIISYAPFDNPKISVVIILENEGYGCKYNIGYINKNIFDYYLINNK